MHRSHNADRDHVTGLPVDDGWITWPISAMARKLTVESGPDEGAVTKLATSDQPWSCASKAGPCQA